MRRRISSPRLLLGLLAVFIVTSCDETTAPPEPASIDLIVETTELRYTESTSFTTVVRDQYGDRMEGVQPTVTVTEPAVLELAGQQVTAAGVGGGELIAKVGAVESRVTLTVEPLVHDAGTLSETVPAYRSLTVRLPSDLEGSAPAGAAGSVQSADDSVFFAPLGDTALVALAPDLADGTHDVRVVIDPRGLYVDFRYTTTAAPAVSDPVAVTDAFVATVESGLDEAIAAAAADGDAAREDAYTAAMAWVDEARAAFDAASPDERQRIAQILEAYPTDDAELGGLLALAAATSPTGASISDALEDAMREYPRTVIKSVVLMTAFVALSYDCIQTGWWPACAAGVAAGAALTWKIMDWADLATDIASNAVKVADDPILQSGLAAPAAAFAASASPMEFVNGASTTLTFEATYRTLDLGDANTGPAFVNEFLYSVVTMAEHWADVSGALQALGAAVGKPDLGLPGSPPAFADPHRTEVRPVPADELALVSVDNDAVSCEEDGATAAFDLACTTESGEDQSFVLTIRHASAFGERELAVEATLVAEPAFSYTVTDLGSLNDSGRTTRANAINDAGQIVGYSETGGTTSRGYAEYFGFLWENGAMTSLGAPEGEEISNAQDINESGQVSVSAFGGYVWHAGSYSARADSLGAGTAINGSGVVAAQAWRWDGATLTRLAPLAVSPTATAINDDGQIVGSYYPADVKRGFIWTNGSVQTLEPLAGDSISGAHDINGLGHVVGYSESPDGTRRGILWADGAATDLGILEGCQGAVPQAINDLGHVAGVGVNCSAGTYEAFLWVDGVFHSLGPGLAEDLNNNGQVVGYQGQKGVLWTVGWD